MTGRQVIRALGVVMGFTLLSRITGFGREMALAYGLGVSAHADAYLFAYTVPNLWAAVFGVAVGKALLPLFTRHSLEGRPERAWRLASNAFNATVLLCLAVTAAGIAGADRIVYWLAPGFPPDAHAEAVEATRIMLPGLLFYCAGSLVATVLQAQRVFALPAATPVAQNLLFSAGALLAPVYGVGVLSWVALGAISLELFVPALGLLKLKGRYTLSLDVDDVGSLGRLAMPLMVGSLGYQAVTAVDWAVASTTGEGSIAALAFADRLRQVPIGLFGAAFTTVLYPKLAELAAGAQTQRLRRLMAEGVYALLAISVPSAAGLMLLRTPIVRILFEHGAFDGAATAATATALLWHSPGLVGITVGALLATGFYALHDTVTPVIAGLAGAGLNALLDVLLAPHMGHGGIALAGSVSALVTALVLYLLLARRLGGLPLPWGTIPGKSLWQSRTAQ